MVSPKLVEHFCCEKLCIIAMGFSVFLIMMGDISNRTIFRDPLAICSNLASFYEGAGRCFHLGGHLK